MTSSPQPAAPVPALASRVLDLAAIRQLRPPNYVIDGVFVRDAITVMYGQPGIGKSLLLLDMLMSVASGMSWQGLQVDAGPTLYNAGEGSGGFGPRVDAWLSNRPGAIPDVRLLPEPMNLLDPLAADQLADYASYISARLVVVDTVARSMPGGDENSPGAMSRLVESADQIRMASGAAVVLCHHTTKKGDVLRGHSSLEGAAQTILNLKKTKSGLTLSCDKQKDDEPFKPMQLSLVKHGSSVVVASGSSPLTGGSLPRSQQAIVDLIEAAGPGAWVPSAQVKAASGVEKSAYHVALNALLDAGLVVDDGKKTNRHLSLPSSGAP